MILDISAFRLFGTAGLFEIKAGKINYMQKDYKALLNLVKIGVTGKCKLPESCTFADVRKAVALSQRQGVACVCINAIDVLRKCGLEVFTKEEINKWLSKYFQIIKRNKKVVSLSIEFANYIAPHKLLVLKGMDYARLWNNPEWREFGDLDCKLLGDLPAEALNEKARSLGCTIDEYNYKHNRIGYKGLTIENHYHFTPFHTSKNTRNLEVIFNELFAKQTTSYQVITDNLVSPDVNFTALFMVFHTYKHFFTEGICLRHLLDWYFFLSKKHDDVDWTLVNKIMEEVKLKAFADIMTLFCNRYLELKSDYKASTKVPDNLLNRFIEEIFRERKVYKNKNFANKIGKGLVSTNRRFIFRSLLMCSFCESIWRIIIHYLKMDSIAV